MSAGEGGFQRFSEELGEGELSFCEEAKGSPWTS